MALLYLPSVVADDFLFGCAHCDFKARVEALRAELAKVEHRQRVSVCHQLKRRGERCFPCASQARFEGSAIVTYPAFTGIYCVISPLSTCPDITWPSWRASWSLGSGRCFRSCRHSPTGTPSKNGQHSSPCSWPGSTFCCPEPRWPPSARSL